MHGPLLDGEGFMNSAAADLYKNDRESYNFMAQEFTRKYAMGKQY